MPKRRREMEVSDDDAAMLPAKTPSCSYNTVFIDTDLDTHLALMVSDVDTVSDLKKKIMSEHLQCFPEMGEIQIRSVKLKRKGKFYHLPNSMCVRTAFEGTRGNWFLYVGGSVSADMVSDEPRDVHGGNNQVGLLCIKNHAHDASDSDIPDDPSKALPPRNSTVVVSCDLGMDVRYVNDERWRSLERKEVSTPMDQEATVAALSHELKDDESNDSLKEKSVEGPLTKKRKLNHGEDAPHKPADEGDNASQSFQMVGNENTSADYNEGVAAHTEVEGKSEENEKTLSNSDFANSKDCPPPDTEERTHQSTVSDSPKLKNDLANIIEDKDFLPDNYVETVGSPKSKPSDQGEKFTSAEHLIPSSNLSDAERVVEHVSKSKKKEKKKKSSARVQQETEMKQNDEPHSNTPISVLNFTTDNATDEIRKDGSGMPNIESDMTVNESTVPNIKEDHTDKVGNESKDSANCDLEMAASELCPPSDGVQADASAKGGKGQGNRPKRRKSIELSTTNQLGPDIVDTDQAAAQKVATDDNGNDDDSGKNETTVSQIEADQHNIIENDGKLPEMCDPDMKIPDVCLPSNHVNDETAVLSSELDTVQRSEVVNTDRTKRKRKSVKKTAEKTRDKLQNADVNDMVSGVSSAAVNVSDDAAKTEALMPHTLTDEATALNKEESSAKNVDMQSSKSGKADTISEQPKTISQTPLSNANATANHENTDRSRKKRKSKKFLATNQDSSSMIPANDAAKTEGLIPHTLTDQVAALNNEQPSAEDVDMQSANCISSECGKADTISEQPVTISQTPLSNANTTENHENTDRNRKKRKSKKFLATNQDSSSMIPANDAAKTEGLIPHILTDQAAALNNEEPSAEDVDMQSANCISSKSGQAVTISEQPDTISQTSLSNANATENLENTDRNRKKRKSKKFLATNQDSSSVVPANDAAKTEGLVPHTVTDQAVALNNEEPSSKDVDMQSANCISSECGKADAISEQPETISQTPLSNANATENHENTDRNRKKRKSKKSLSTNQDSSSVVPANDAAKTEGLIPHTTDQAAALNNGVSFAKDVDMQAANCISSECGKADTISERPETVSQTQLSNADATEKHENPGGSQKKRKSKKSLATNQDSSSAVPANVAFGVSSGHLTVDGSKDQSLLPSMETKKASLEGPIDAPAAVSQVEIDEVNASGTECLPVKQGINEVGPSQLVKENTEKKAKRKTKKNSSSSGLSHSVLAKNDHEVGVKELLSSNDNMVVVNHLPKADEASGTAKDSHFAQVAVNGIELPESAVNSGQLHENHEHNREVQLQPEVSTNNGEEIKFKDYFVSGSQGQDASANKVKKALTSFDESSSTSSAMSSRKLQLKKDISQSGSDSQRLTSKQVNKKITRVISAQTSDSSTQSPSSSSSSSGFSVDGSELSSRSPKKGATGGKRSRSHGGSYLKSKDLGAKTMDEILKSSKRFKKAKATAARQLQLESESQPIDFVPESQPN